MSSVLEAMAYNGLVLTTYKNGNEEFIEDGVNGYLVQPEDVDALSHKMLEIMHDPRVADIRARAQQTVKENFTWDRFNANLNAITDRVVNKKQNRP